MQWNIWDQLKTEVKLIIFVLLTSIISLFQFPYHFYNLPIKFPLHILILATQNDNSSQELVMRGEKIPLKWKTTGASFFIKLYFCIIIKILISSKYNKIHDQSLQHAETNLHHRWVWTRPGVHWKFIIRRVTFRSGVD